MYILQALTILLAPALFAASIYMVLGRIIRLLDAAHLSLVRVTWLTKIFVAGDVLSFAAQGIGGGILSSADSKTSQDLGNTVILVGLGIQVVVFGLFIITTILFHLRIAKQPTAKSFSVTTDWKGMIWVLYASSGLILVRSLFRMIEYAMGWDSVLMQSEVYLFVLDGVLMVLVGIMFLWWHPGKVLIGYKETGTKGNGGLVESTSADEAQYGIAIDQGVGRGAVASRGESQFEMVDQRSRQV